MSKRWGTGFDVNQLQLNWQERLARTQERGVAPSQRRNQASPKSPYDTGEPVLRLRWDFRTRFPQPTDDAMNEGILQPEDAQPENLAALHLAHADRMMATLSDIDAASLGVRSNSGASPAQKAASGSEPGRLRRWYESLLGAYRDWFGDEAADAFDQAVRAWHARIEVVIDNGLVRDDVPPNNRPRIVPPANADQPNHESVAVISEALPAVTTLDSSPPLLPAPNKHNPIHPVRVIARLPVPRPLPEAVKEGDFGRDENGRCINPSAREVREITDNHAEQLLLLIQEGRNADMAQQDDVAQQYHAGTAQYASSFGSRAAEQLDAYVRRQAEDQCVTPVWRSTKQEAKR